MRMNRLLPVLLLASPLVSNAAMGQSDSWSCQGKVAVPFQMKPGKPFFGDMLRRFDPGADPEPGMAYSVAPGRTFVRGVFGWRAEGARLGRTKLTQLSRAISRASMADGRAELRPKLAGPDGLCAVRKDLELGCSDEAAAIYKDLPVEVVLDKLTEELHQEQVRLKADLDVEETLRDTVTVMAEAEKRDRWLEFRFPKGFDYPVYRLLAWSWPQSLSALRAGDKGSLDACPDGQIRFGSEVVVEAQRNPGSSDKKLTIGFP